MCAALIIMQIFSGICMYCHLFIVFSEIWIYFQYCIEYCTDFLILIQHWVLNVDSILYWIFYESWILIQFCIGSLLSIVYWFKFCIESLLSIVYWFNSTLNLYWILVIDSILHWIFIEHWILIQFCIESLLSIEYWFNSALNFLLSIGYWFVTVFSNFIDCCMSI